MPVVEAKPARAGLGPNEPLRIGLFAPALPASGASNGIVTYVRIMRDALEALGHLVITVTPTEIEIGGTIAPVPRSNKLFRRLRKIIALRGTPANGADAWVTLQVLEAFEAARSAGAQLFEIEESFGWAGLLVGRGVPIVERLHGPHVYGRLPIETAAQKHSSDLRVAAESASLKIVQAITCPSQRLLDAMVQRYDLPASCAHVIPNPIPTAAPAARWHLANADADTILCVGRFDLRKGADIAIRAFVQALQTKPSLRLVMVGPDTGLANANGEIIHFDEFVRAEVPPESRARIQFLGVQSADSIHRLRLESGCALVASRFENFAYSIAEAMALGMPVIATDSFGNSEMIRDGVDGRIVPVADVDSMAQAMVELGSSPDRLDRMGASAYQRAAEWLSPERIARQTVDVYRKALATLKI